MTEKRTSKITKSIKRLYNVAQYESLEIAVNYEDVIEWETPQERQTKSANISKLLLKDFEDTRNQVFVELNVSEKKAYFKNALDSIKNV